MCILALRSTTNRDGQIQQDDRRTLCNDGSQDINFQQSSIEEHEKKAEISFIKTPSSPRKKFEAAFNLDRSLSEEAVEDEDLGELRAGLESADKNLKTQKLQDKTKNLKEEYPQLEKEKVQGKRKSITQILRCWSVSVEPPMTVERHLDYRALEMKEEKELKAYMSKMFWTLFLSLLINNISGNITCRQTFSGKYPCLNSILFLLWQSGDVEANPGPPNSISYRNWLYDICSIIRKVIAGVSTDCTMKNIWQKSPKNWPSKELYFDPRNSNRSVKEVEIFLYMLIQCCQNISKLSDEIMSEIKTWNRHNRKDNVKLLNMYTSRICCRSAEKNGKLIRSNLLVDEVLRLEVKPGIQVSLSRQSATDQKFPPHKMYRAELTRKIASILCKILHGKNTEKKCDNLWTKKPDWWPSDLRYYNPNNGGKRCFKNEDAMLVEALITLCKQKSIILPRSYQDMVEAWQANNQTLLSKLLTRHTAETDLKKAVMKLHEEGLLQNQKVEEQLIELGLLVQCDGSTQNVKSQKRKIANTMNKHETKRTKQSDHEDAVDTTLKELLPGCSFGQLLDNQSDSLLLDKISQNIPDFLGDQADDVQFHWT